MGTYNNSPIGDSAFNNRHGQRFFSSLRDSRATYKPTVASPTKKIKYTSCASKVREALKLHKEGNKTEAQEIVNQMLAQEPQNWCAQEA